MLIVQAVALTVAMWTGAGPAGSPDAKEQRVAAAYQQFEKQRHVEAAIEFEALWRDYKEARFLFNAAVTRYTARHYAHAVAYLNEYLALDEVKGQDRGEAEAQLQVARREVTSVRASVQAAGVTGEVRLSAQRVSELASDLRPPLPIALSPMVSGDLGGAIELDPGKWRLRAEAPGAEPSEVEIEVVTGAPTTAELTIKPVVQETGPKEPVTTGRDVDTRKIAVASLAAGGGLAGIGIIVTAVGHAVKFKPALAANSMDCSVRADLIACSQALDRGLELRGAGAGLLGVGIGAAAGSVVWLVRQPQRRRLGWIVEAGVGGAALIGGIVGMAVGAKGVNRFNAEFTTADEAMWAEIQGGVKGPAAAHTASAAIFGIGAGLLTSAALGFGLSHAGKPGAGTRAARSLRVGGSALPGTAGLSLSGRF